jgi:hypothetical protein
MNVFSTSSWNVNIRTEAAPCVVCNAAAINIISENSTRAKMLSGRAEVRSRKGNFGFSGASGFDYYRHSVETVCGNRHWTAERN